MPNNDDFNEEQALADAARESRASFPIEDIQLTLIQSHADVLDMLDWLGNRREWLAFDVETTGLNVGCDYIRLAQFGDHTHSWALDWRDWRGICKEVIEGYEGKIVAHNLLFDSKMLKADNVILPQRHAHDTMIMCHLKNPRGFIDLKGASTVYVDKRARHGQSMLKAAMSAGKWSWATVPIDLPAYWQYACLDTSLTALLADKLWKDTGGGQFEEAYELELAVIHCLREAELAGMLVDEEYRIAAEAKLRIELDALAPQIPLKNPRSDDQLRAYLQRLGARWEVYTEKGKLAVDKTVLKWLSPQFPVCLPIMEYRTKAKLLDSYITKLGEIGTTRNGLAVDGVLRPSTKPVGAKTGRMSITEPPLQTLPRGRHVRDGIIAREGNVFVGADFAGMEMRALAAEAAEAGMLAIFRAGLDVHSETARKLYGEAFSKKERSICKNAGFAKIYGAGIPKFAATAEIDVVTAEGFLQSYDGLYPGVAGYMERVTQRIYERAGGRDGTGYVKLIDGRHIPVSGDEAYKGVNYRIQGSCAVVTKRKIVELDHAGLGPYFRLPVHDELIYEVPIEDAADVRAELDRIMPDTRSFAGITLTTESDTFQRWGQHYRHDGYEKYIETPDPEWLD